MAKVHGGALSRPLCPAWLCRSCWKRGRVPCDCPRHTPCAKVQWQGATSGILRERTCLLHMRLALALSGALVQSSLLCPSSQPCFCPCPVPLQLSGPSAGSHKQSTSLFTWQKLLWGNRDQKVPLAVMAPAGIFSSHTRVPSLHLLVQPGGLGESWRDLSMHRTICSACCHGIRDCENSCYGG